jgi:hypothetical protein
MEPTYFFDNEEDEDRKLEFLKQEEPFRVFTFGLAFVCLKKGVMEAIERPWFEFGSYERTTESGVKYRQVVGEDFMFCRKIADAGFEMYVDPKIRIGHMKTRALGISK